MPGDRGGSECTIPNPANVGQYDLSLPHMETERRAEPEIGIKKMAGRSRDREAG